MPDDLSYVAEGVINDTLGTVKHAQAVIIGLSAEVISEMRRSGQEPSIELRRIQALASLSFQACDNASTDEEG